MNRRERNLYRTCAVAGTVENSYTQKVLAVGGGDNVLPEEYSVRQERLVLMGGKILSCEAVGEVDALSVGIVNHRHKLNRCAKSSA